MDADHPAKGVLFARRSTALGIAFSREEGVDERYLHRCFSRDEAEQVMDAVHAFARDLKHDPLPPCKATADLRAAIIHRTDNVILIQ